MEQLCIHKTGEITLKEAPLKGSVFRVLGNTVILEDGVTLGSIFLMLEKYPDLLKLSDMLESLLEMARNGMAASGFKTEEIESLCFYKTIEIKGFPGEPSLNFYNSLKGIKNSSLIDLKFFHLEALLEHILTLGHLEHVVFGDKEDSFSYRTFYTLFELVEGIGWDLSFNFNPLECSLRR